MIILEFLLELTEEILKVGDYGSQGSEEPISRILVWEQYSLVKIVV
jgi:hypothetical protein